jgi:hypothetical protein
MTDSEKTKPVDWAKIRRDAWIYGTGAYRVRLAGGMLSIQHVPIDPGDVYVDDVAAKSDED